MKSKKNTRAVKRNLSDKDLKNSSKSTNNNVRKRNINNQNKKNNFQIFFSNYYTFYKENIKKKHIVVFVICLCIFFITFATCMSKITSSPDIATLIKNSEETQQNSASIISIIFKQNIPSVFVTMLAGIVPYVYIPVVGIGYAYIYAVNIIEYFATFSHTGNVIFMTIGAIINLVAISYAVATGMHYCKLVTKKQKYNRTDNYTINDVRKKFYKETKNEEKLKKLEEKIKKREIERQNAYVKVPYVNLLVSFLISSIIIIIGSLISII